MTIDRTSWLWRKGRPLLVSTVTLLAVGYAVEPLHHAAWQEVRAREVSLNLKDLGENLGQGTLLGVLGGFRSIVADFVWLQGYNYWEKHDPAGTMASIELAATLDPNNLMFWDEGSKIIGLDMPAWRLRQLPPPTDAEMNAVIDTQARKAIAFLQRGLQFQPDNYDLLFDIAEMYFNRLDDLPDAATYYHKAAQVTDIPYLATRFYIRLLRLMGRNQEAYDYLVKFYPHLPNDMPEVQKGLMWAWIQGLEEVLKIPPDQRLPESMAPPGWKAEDYMQDFRDLSAKSPTSTI